MTAPTLAAGRDRLVGIPRRRSATQVGIVVAVSALPLLRPSGPGNTGLVDVGLVLVILVASLWLSGHGHVVRLPYALPVALSLVAGTLGGLAAGGGILALVQDLFLFGWAVAVANLGRSPELLGTLVRAWALSVTGWAALLLVGVLVHASWLSGQTGLDGSRASLTFGDPNLAADYFLCGLLVLRAARVPRRSGPRLLCCAVIVTAIVLTGSNGGLSALLVATVAGSLFGLVRSGRAAAATLFACFLLTLGTVALSTVDLASVAARARQSAPVLRDSIGREAESGGSRQTLVREGFSLWLRGESPLGLGPGGTKAALLAEQSPYVKEAHNDYVAALVERGVLGGAGLAALIVLVVVRARRIARPGRAAAGVRRRDPPAGTARRGRGRRAMSALFYEVLHFRHVWALFGLIAAARAVGPAAGDRAPPAPVAARAGIVPATGRGAGMSSTVSGRPAAAARGAPAAGRQRRGAAGRAGRARRSPPSWSPASAGPRSSAGSHCCGCCPGWPACSPAAGLPGAAPYFLAGARRHDPRAAADAGAAHGGSARRSPRSAGWPSRRSCTWCSSSPGRPGSSLVAAIAVVHPAVRRRRQGAAAGRRRPARRQRGDRRRGGGVPAGLPGCCCRSATAAATVVAALVLADVAVAVGIAERLRRRRLLPGWRRPDLAARAGRSAAYGMRGQLGGLLSLVNLRLDVAILGALAGPAVLGVYAIASKYAELLRLPGLAVTYVLYPAFARGTRPRRPPVPVRCWPARRLTALAAVPLRPAAGSVLPLVYGDDFAGAIVPAWILLAGLVGEGVPG